MCMMYAYYIILAKIYIEHTRISKSVKYSMCA